MAFWLARLIGNGVEPRRIQVLMFNRLARLQFRNSLNGQNLNPSRHPHVHTFHGYAWHLLKDLPNWPADSWNDEQIHFHLLRVRGKVVKNAREHFGPECRVTKNDIDIEMAKTAISLWKGALIPPDRAGFHPPRGSLYESMYREFERERLRQNAITFDDYVPYAVYALEGSEALRQLHISPLLHLVVDEYQDVNPGQQRLLELLASEGADVMVVGDDDQTIYEWRGARSYYILSGYTQAFPHKPWDTYALSHSFRFGEAIAKASDNVIQRNPGRHPKKLTAYDPGKDCRIVQFRGEHANRDIITEIQAWCRGQMDLSTIRVLVRSYAQVNNLEVHFLRERIPYYVVGRLPLHKTPECQAFLNYGRVAAALDRPLTQANVQNIRSIANKPTRYLAQSDLNQLFDQSLQQRWTVAETLSWGGTYLASAGERLKTFLDLLRNIRVEMQSRAIGNLLAWMLEHTQLRQHFRDYYGPGEHSLDRVKYLESLVEYAGFEAHRDLTWRDFMVHLNKLDSKQGRPEDQCIAVTTIHRVKGLEFEYVIVPDCGEGYMPVISEKAEPEFVIFDRSQPERIPPPSKDLVNERRLFYVALTRSSRILLLGGPHDPHSMDTSRFLAEMSAPLSAQSPRTTNIQPTLPTCPLPDLPDMGLRKQKLLVCLQAVPLSVLEIAGPLAMKARQKRQWGARYWRFYPELGLPESIWKDLERKSLIHKS